METTRLNCRHEGSVNCMAVGQADESQCTGNHQSKEWFVTGSQDGTVRLGYFRRDPSILGASSSSTRTTRSMIRHCRCWKAPSSGTEITAVALWQNSFCSFSNVPQLTVLFATTENAVYQYTTLVLEAADDKEESMAQEEEEASSRIQTAEDTMIDVESTHQIFQTEDEINQLQILPDSSSSSKDIATLLVADDTGLVHVLRIHHHHPTESNTETPTPTAATLLTEPLNHNTSTNAETTACLVLSCIIYQSKYLITGASDCQVRCWTHWTTAQPKLLYTRSMTSTTNDTTASNSNQLCNPPMVHQLIGLSQKNNNNNNNTVVAACGDGSVVLFQATTGVVIHRLYEAHNGPVADLTLWYPQEELLSVPLLVTTGNDQRVAVWDLGSVVIEPPTTNTKRKPAKSPRDWLFPPKTTDATPGTKMKKKKKSPKKKGMSDTAYVDDDDDDWLLRGPEILVSWEHTAGKPNAIAAISGNRLLLADTSSDVTVYTIRP